MALIEAIVVACRSDASTELDVACGRYQCGPEVQNVAEEVAPKHRIYPSVRWEDKVGRLVGVTEN
jgi:hypothetical protein